MQSIPGKSSITSMDTSHRHPHGPPIDIRARKMHPEMDPIPSNPHLHQSCDHMGCRFKSEYISELLMYKWLERIFRVHDNSIQGSIKQEETDSVCDQHSTTTCYQAQDSQES